MYVFTVNNNHNKLEPIKVTEQVNSANLQMEVDTGVATSVINNCRYQQLWPKNKRPPLCSTKIHQGVIGNQG